MPKATIYQFRVWKHGVWELARRWGTREGIEQMNPPGLEFLESSAVDIHSELLNSNQMSRLGFDPHTRFENVAMLFNEAVAMHEDGFPPDRIMKALIELGNNCGFVVVTRGLNVEFEGESEVIAYEGRTWHLRNRAAR